MLVCGLLISLERDSDHEAAENSVIMLTSLSQIIEKGRNLPASLRLCQLTHEEIRDYIGILHVTALIFRCAGAADPVTSC